MEEIKLKDRLTIFQGLLSSCNGPALSLFDAHLHRFSDENEQTAIADALLALCSKGRTLSKTISQSRSPLLFTGQINVSWLFFPVFESKELVRVYALGPFLNENTTPFSFDAALSDIGAALSLRAEASVLRRTLPVLPYRLIQAYASMLYRLIHDEYLDPSSIRFFGRSTPSRSQKKNRKMVNLTPADLYSFEQEALRKVREGEIDDQVGAANTFDAATPSGSTDLNHLKAIAYSRLTLLSRAAIEGGLSAETGLMLCDRYGCDLENAGSALELENIVTLGQRDLAERVRAIKTRNMSKLIESACAYIDRKLEEELSIAQLADRSGLTEYYFSRRFKRETGLSPTEFIRRKRLQKAANLLTTTDIDVHQIALQLRFCSVSYFSDLFHRYFGASPREYRKGGSQ